MMKFDDFFSIEFLNELDIIDWGYTQEDKPTTFEHYRKWVDQKLHGPLGYLADERFHKRESLKNVYPEFQSAMVFHFPYIKEKKYLLENEKNNLAAYAFAFNGNDYHHVIKDRLEKILEKLKSEHDCEGVVAVDTMPILERDISFRSGLGWTGKNSMLINRSYGSYFMIGSLLLNKKFDLDYKELEVDHCGQCTRCLDACPTDAITDSRTIDSSKCISTFTIELFKDSEPPEGYAKTDYFFGCDICQEVCPWNSKPLSRVDGEVLLSEKQELIHFFDDEPESLIEKLEGQSNKAYKRMFKGTSLERTGRLGMLKNLLRK